MGGRITRAIAAVVVVVVVVVEKIIGIEIRMVLQKTSMGKEGDVKRGGEREPRR